MNGNMKMLAYRIIHKFKSLMGKKTKDDFHWDYYNTHYRGELEEILKTHSQILKDGDYIFKENRLIKSNSGIADLHMNHRLLYETILQLNPESVLELGCGGGDHLHNLSILYPKLKLVGLDLSEKQLQFLRERHPDFKGDVRQCDCAKPFPADIPKVDVAYTQAVIMHIKTGDKHKVALENLFRVATRQVVLMENWNCHDFFGDVKSLFEQGRIPWKEIYFYYRDVEELKRPHMMLVSSVPLSRYKELADYALLTAGV